MLSLGIFFCIYDFFSSRSRIFVLIVSGSDFQSRVSASLGFYHSHTSYCRVSSVILTSRRQKQANEAILTFASPTLDFNCEYRALSVVSEGVGGRGYNSGTGSVVCTKYLLTERAVLTGKFQRNNFPVRTKHARLIRDLLIFSTNICVS